jgi:6-pyruvoyltetrahydropterin/6-carboxytetrahydropterin synthase
MDISKEFRFEASHCLPKHPGRCQNLHGHSWKLTVHVSGNVNHETGFVMDYGDIKEAVQPVIDRLDHHHLGTWIPPYYGAPSFRCSAWEVHYMPRDFYPSSENLIVWIGTQIDDLLGKKLKKFWSKLELNETCTSSCVLTREEYERIIASSSRSVETTNRTVKEEQVIP